MKSIAHAPIIVIAIAIAICLLTQKAPAADAIPEPPRIFYGTITRAPTATHVTPTTVEWQIDGGGNSVTISATQVITIDTQTFYLSKIPFETRQLADSTPLGATANTLEQTSVDTSYTRSAKVDGQNAVLPAGTGSFTHSATTSDLIERLDLVIGETFAEWALRVLGDADADPEGDADNDGSTNQEEFYAGTDPTDGNSLPSFDMAPQAGGGLQITFPTIVGQTYVVERSTNLEQNDWTEVTETMVGTGEPMSFTDASANQPRLFYRITSGR